MVCDGRRAARGARAERAPRSGAGLTLVEMIVVIVIAGIVAGIAARFIAGPVKGFVDTARRAELVDAADTALKHMIRELRQALPNSIRVACSGRCIEFLRVLEGGRYRARPPGDPLRFTPASPDDRFDVVGQLQRLAEIDTGPGPNDCVQGRADCLVIYNTGQPGANAWASDNMATITAVVDDGAADGSDHIRFNNLSFSSGRAFPYPSPQQRFYVVDTPVTFHCDLTAGTIRRYQDYRIEATQPTDPASPPLSLAPSPPLVVDRVSACRFTYSPGSSTRAGLVTATLTVTEAGESVTLLQQAHVPNQP